MRSFILAGHLNVSPVMSSFDRQLRVGVQGRIHAQKTFQYGAEEIDVPPCREKPSCRISISIFPAADHDARPQSACVLHDNALNRFDPLRMGHAHCFLAPVATDKKAEKGF